MFFIYLNYFKRVVGFASGQVLVTHLVCGQNVWEEVAATGSQQVHLLTHVVPQLVKAGFGGSHLSLDLRHKPVPRSGSDVLSTSVLFTALWRYVATSWGLMCSSSTTITSCCNVIGPMACGPRRWTHPTSFLTQHITHWACVGRSGSMYTTTS